MSRSYTLHQLERVAFNLGFRVDENGVVIHPDGHKIYGSKTHDGYLRFRISKRSKILRIHRLAAYQKFGEAIYAPGIVCRHLDGNPSNSRPDNIAIGTDSDNMMDIPKVVRLRKAIHASRCAQIHDHHAILNARKCGLTYKQLRDKFGIRSKGAIAFIVRRSIAAKTEIAARRMVLAL